MSGSAVFPLPTRCENSTILPGKLKVKADDALPFSLLFIFSQILWYSVGLSVIYDVTERIWHWPHLVVAGVYGGMLVASAWLSRRAVKWFSGLTVILLAVVATVALAKANFHQEFLQGLVAILKSRYIDYCSWFFVMGSSILGCLSVVWIKDDKQVNLALWVALVSFLLGCAIAIMPEATQMRSKGADLETILASQGLTIIWLVYWGMPMRSYGGKGNEGYLNRFIAKYLKLPMRTIILTMGAVSYIFYDWVCQYLATWLQIIWFFAPVVVYFYMQKRRMSAEATSQ